MNIRSLQFVIYEETDKLKNDLIKQNFKAYSAGSLRVMNFTSVFF